MAWKPHGALPVCGSSGLTRPSVPSTKDGVEHMLRVVELEWNQRDTPKAVDVRGRAPGSSARGCVWRVSSSVHLCHSHAFDASSAMMEPAYTHVCDCEPTVSGGNELNAR